MGEKSTLAQKYRPLVFKDVLGQEAITTVLENIIKNKKFSSPFMFTGLYGGGKTTLARILARAILCKNLRDGFEPCNECPSCVSFLEETNLAYTEIDAASNSGVDKMRKLREDANFSVLGDYDKKVIVIDECHSITTQGNEALLKQLEDSNSKQIYIFCTTAPEKMLDTVRSRCFEFSLNKISEDSITTRLQEISDKEGIKYEVEGLKLISSMCAPHVRDSIKNLDYLNNFGVISKKIVFDHFKLELNSDYLKVIKYLGTNIKESMKIVNNLILTNNVTHIYEGLIKNILKCFKLSFGVDEFKNEGQKKLGNEILGIYGSNLAKILEELLNRNRYVDSLTLESDIALLSKKLGSGFNMSFAPIEVTPVTNTGGKIEKSVATGEIVEEYDKLEEDVLVEIETKKEPEIEKSLEETSKILKRYKSYPEGLAILMDKGKKSSSIKSSFTVELKQEVIDYKKTIDKEDIKKYLNNKRTPT